MDTSVNSSSSNSSFHPQTGICSESIVSGFIYTSWLIIYILFLPVFISVFYIGYKRWRNHQPVSTSHTDVFTFHVVAMEMIIIVSSCLYCWGLFTELKPLVMTGKSIFVMATNGQKLFHVLTCVERYLAVVHPITYRGLKQSGGVRIRNISVGCIWLISFGLVCALHVLPANDCFYQIFDGLWWGLCFAFVSFCSFSTLYVLIRPGPGEVGRVGKQTSQSKRRAFHTMVPVMGAQLMGLTVHLSTGLVSSLKTEVACVIVMLSFWFNLPSSLVLPFLFLHRAGKLPSCKQ